jgi:tetratricopeptide (TPR) repeat protein
MRKQIKNEHRNIQVFTHRTFAVFISLLLLSDVGIAAGRYEVKAQQQPKSQLATSAAAKRLFDEGFKLYQQGTAESLRQAIGKWEEALKLYQQINDKKSEALILLGIGKVYDNLGEKQKALSYYNQALPWRRQVGDKHGEATTLNNIGGVYSNLGEKQKALSYYNQALPLRRQVGDKGGEAGTLNNIGLVYSN